MNSRIWLGLGCIIALLVLGCGPKIMFPPEIDLRDHESVGLIDFASEAEGKLGKFVTQKFMEEISYSQKGVRIIELGSMDSVLQSIRKNEMNPEATQAIGKKYKLKSLIIGNLEVSDIKPKLSLSSLVSHMSVKAEVEASIAVKLLETEQGATLWTASARDKKDVAHVSIFSGGAVHFDADNPEEAYGDLAESLIEEVTRDLKVSYRRR